MCFAIWDDLVAVFLAPRHLGARKSCSGEAVEVKGFPEVAQFDMP